MKKTFTLFTSLICFATLNAQTPTCSSNLLPENNASGVSPAPYITLKWNPVAGATYYNVYFNAKLPPTKITGSAVVDTFNITDAQYNTKYYWYVVPVNANGAAMNCGVTTTSFTTGPQPVPPVNDNCSGAIDISTAVAASTLGATQSQPADVCGGYTGFADDDVWFQFTATSTGTVTIILSGGSNFDGVLELFTGSCGSLTSLTCSDQNAEGGNESITISAVAGTNYKVRVYSFGSAIGDRGDFSIAATGEPLPVSLIDFKGENINGNNVLSWSTATEINNKGFQVQYSIDGKNFQNIGFVNSKQQSGNSASVLNYQFTDSKYTSGNAYYRLVQVDKDGKSNFSKIILIKGKQIAALTLNAVYPNPAREKLSLAISSPVNSKIDISIVDLTGKILRRQAFPIMKGGNNVEMQTASLAAGTYFIKAGYENGTQTAVSKFVKQ